MKIAQLLATRIDYFTLRGNVNDHSNFHRENKVHGSRSQGKGYN